MHAIGALADRLVVGRQALTRACVATCLLLALPASLTAQSGHPVFDARGFQDNRDYFSQFPFENIDTLSGGLVLTFTDLVLPGHAGFDVRFERTYNSKDAGRPAWTFGLSGLVMEVFDTGHIPQPGDQGRYEPRLRTGDGAEHSTIWVAGPGDNYRWVITGRFWKYDRSERKAYLPDGRVLSFDGNRQLAEVVDPYGNRVTLTREPQTLRVVQHLGDGQSREVVLHYQAGSPLPSSMTYLGRTWTYDYTPGFRAPQLEWVTPPVGPVWQFEYTADELTRVHTPSGGEI